VHNNVDTSQPTSVHCLHLHQLAVLGAGKEYLSRLRESENGVHNLGLSPQTFQTQSSQYISVHCNTSVVDKVSLMQCG